MPPLLKKMDSLSKTFNKFIFYINTQIQFLRFVLLSLAARFQWRKKRPQSSSSAVLPDELILEIISWLPVKPLIRFRCVNNFFKTIVSDPHFVQMHLNKSSRNPHLALTLLPDFDVTTFPISRLLDNSSIQDDHFYRLPGGDGFWSVAGSCNGLICLINVYTSWLCFWNPSTRTKFNFFLPFSDDSFHYSFGYDPLTKTYKVVALRITKEHGDAARSMVKFFTLGDSSWRNIQYLPVIPLYWFPCVNKDGGVYLSRGTVNWLAVRDYFEEDCLSLKHRSIITIEQYVILSLDLSTETYTQLLLPRGFDKVPLYRPKLVVLMDSLCFCHDYEATHFVIWQMKDFGVQESWIQLYKISYKNLFSAMGYICLNLLPLYLSENGDTLILTNDRDEIALIYNCRDNRVEKIGITNRIMWSWAKCYVESLVSTR